MHSQWRQCACGTTVDELPESFVRHGGAELSLSPAFVAADRDPPSAHRRPIFVHVKPRAPCRRDFEVDLWPGRSDDERPPSEGGRLDSPVDWTTVWLGSVEHFAISRDTGFLDNALYLLLEHPW